MAPAHDSEPTDQPRLWLPVEPLRADTFAAFGQVIEARSDGLHYPINEGFAERFHDLAALDTGRDDGRPVLSLFRAKPRERPFELTLVERHALGSQAFLPLHGQRFLVVVAAPGPAPTPRQLRCFLADGGQGVNYAAGTWHHPLIALDDGGDFVVIDRGGPGAAADCEEHRFAGAGVWV